MDIIGLAEVLEASCSTRRTVNLFIASVLLKITGPLYTQAGQNMVALSPERLAAKGGELL